MFHHTHMYWWLHFDTRFVEGTMILSQFNTHLNFFSIISNINLLNIVHVLGYQRKIWLLISQNKKW